MASDEATLMLHPQATLTRFFNENFARQARNADAESLRKAEEAVVQLQRRLCDQATNLAMTVLVRMHMSL